MYEGNIYLSYQEPRVIDNCGRDITRQSPGHNVLTIASGDLHSLRKFPHALAPFPVTWDLVPWPVNFDDFNPPTPFSAYAGQRECAQPGLDTSSCTVVKPGEYYPYMLMPPQIRDLDPNWRTCLFDKYAAFDPPIALHTRGNMFSTINAQPTSIKPLEPINTPPLPGQSGGNNFVKPTLTPGNLDAGHNPPTSRPPAPPDNTPTRTDIPRPHEPVDVPAPVITVGPSIIPIDPSGGLIIQPGLTLTDGDPPMIIDGTELSLGPSAIFITDATGTSTIPVPPVSNSHNEFITIGRSVFSIDTSGALVIEPGLTLKTGAPPVTIDSTVISVGHFGIILVDSKGTSTISIPGVAKTGQLIAIGSATYTVVSGNLILGDKLTLSMSEAAAILSGTTISVGSQGIMIVSSSRTAIIPIESNGVERHEQDAEPSSNAESSKEDDAIANSAHAATHGISTLFWLASAVCLILTAIMDT